MARTVRTKVYFFNELSEEAKERAIEWYRSTGSDDGHYDEIIESVKALCELFGLKSGSRSWSDLRASHIDNDVLELKGVRLYKYLVNNYYDQLFTPSYIKALDRVVYWKQFVCKKYSGRNGDYSMIFSRNRRNNSCVLTGGCYDESILQPVYDFLKKPDASTTFEDLISEMESAIDKTFRDEEENVNSDEYIIETIEANEYEFTKDGDRFP